MSMSTNVVGFHPPDEAWQKMKAIWDACEKADIEVPIEVEHFFGGSPDENGIRVELPIREYYGDGEEGFELNVTDIPKNVTVIRFYNSW